MTAGNKTLAEENEVRWVLSSRTLAKSTWKLQETPTKSFDARLSGTTWRSGTGASKNVVYGVLLDTLCTVEVRP